jgi:nitronate monooxygenase
MDCPAGTDCLSACGSRGASRSSGTFYIDTRLAASLRGNVAHGQFFRGHDALPFGSAIPSVREWLVFLVWDVEPAAADA